MENPKAHKLTKKNGEISLILNYHCLINILSIDEIKIMNNRVFKKKKDIFRIELTNHQKISNHIEVNLEKNYFIWDKNVCYLESLLPFFALAYTKNSFFRNKLYKLHSNMHKLIYKLIHQFGKQKSNKINKFKELIAKELAKTGMLKIINTFPNKWSTTFNNPGDMLLGFHMLHRLERNNRYSNFY